MGKRLIKALITAAIWMGIAHLLSPSFALCYPFLIALGLMMVLNTYQPDFQTGDSGPAEDRQSAQFIVISVTVPNLIFTLEAIYLREPASLSYEPIEYGFLLIAALGLVSRIHAIHTLGKFFTWHVHIAQDQQLIQDGLYRWFRHPSYFGAFFLFTFIPLTLNAYIAAGLSALLQFMAYRYRISIEEIAMTERFGDAYRDYQKRAWAFLPGIH